MIKTEDNITKLSCDSCHVKIASCENFNFEDGQELVLSPLLCESCGQKHNKSIGDNAKKIDRLEKMLEAVPRKECKLDKDMLGIDDD
jgi:transcription elongation factor Elf1